MKKIKVIDVDFYKGDIYTTLYETIEEAANINQNAVDYMKGEMNDDNTVGVVREDGPEGFIQVHYNDVYEVLEKVTDVDTLNVGDKVLFSQVNDFSKSVEATVWSRHFDSTKKFVGFNDDNFPVGWEDCESKYTYNYGIFNYDIDNYSIELHRLSEVNVECNAVESSNKKETTHKVLSSKDIEDLLTNIENLQTITDDLHDQIASNNAIIQEHLAFNQVHEDTIKEMEESIKEFNALIEYHDKAVENLLKQ